MLYMFLILRLLEFFWHWPTTNMDIPGIDTVYTKKSIKTIRIGAGVSGILLAYKLKQHCARFSRVQMRFNSKIIE
jgi:hypothetical protein